MTGAAPKKTGGPDISCGPSVDQLIAQKYGQETLLPSIQLGIEDPGSNTGVCGWGYSCAYSNSISWAGANKPLPHEVNPLVVFERLFGDGATPEERQARRMANRSILDAVTGKIGGLKKTLPAGDKLRMDAYLENVREVERRLQIATQSTSAAPEMDMPFAPPQSIDAHIKLMWDLQVLAFQTDTTRISTFMLAHDGSNRSFPEIGVPDGSRCRVLGHRRRVDDGQVATGLLERLQPARDQGREDSADRNVTTPPRFCPEA
jgi:hypothetical protein